jgi:hypothetical protein
MKDMDLPPDAGIPDVRPDDPEEQSLYLRRLRHRYRKESAVLDQAQLREMVLDRLKLCPRLRIRDPRDVLRFLALSVLITPIQRQSPFIDNVMRRILEAVNDWSATKRLDFIYKHVVGRPVPVPEPDFGPWVPFFIHVPHEGNDLES